MDLYALKKDYTIACMISSNNVQWNRKYYELGDFSIQIPATDYIPEMYYVYMEGRDDLGVIQKIEYTEEYGKKYVQLSGFFAECELNDKIVYPTFYANGNIETEITRMINMYKEDIPNLVTSSVKLLGSKIEFQETFGNLADVAYTRLQTQELSQKIKYDFVTGIKYYEIWQGKDRTQSQSENNFVVFSTEFDNINNPIVSEDSSNEKNWALVGGSGEGEERIFVTVDLSSGGYKKKIFIDAAGESYDEQKQTLEEYKANLKQYGIEKMLEYKKIQNVDFVSTETGYEYLVDFDLGDKCDVIIESLQLSLEARIIAIYEVFKDNTHTLELEFGDKKMTLYQKARLDR